LSATSLSENRIRKKRTTDFTDFTDKKGYCFTQKSARIPEFSDLSDAVFIRAHP